MNTAMDPATGSRFLRDSDLELVAKKQAEIRAATSIESIDIDTASDADLRLVIKELLRRGAAPAIEPLGLDQFAGLPVFLDKPECPRCHPFTEAIIDPKTGQAFAMCHDCTEAIPHSIEFQNHGIESATVDHLHLHTVQNAGGRQIRIPARRELCLPCFRKDWAKVHPDKLCDL